MMVSAIIVNYNTRETTLECLRALEAGLAGIPSEVWVVDNGSTDASAETFRKEFPIVRLIESAVNIGFGAANNMAMRQAGGRYFLLIEQRRVSAPAGNHAPYQLSGGPSARGDCGSAPFECGRITANLLLQVSVACSRVAGKPLAFRRISGSSVHRRLSPLGARYRKGCRFSRWRLHARAPRSIRTDWRIRRTIFSLFRGDGLAAPHW